MGTRWDAGTDTVPRSSLKHPLTFWACSSGSPLGNFNHAEDPKPEQKQHNPAALHLQRTGAVKSIQVRPQQPTQKGLSN